MRIQGCVRFVHPGLPGENNWCVSRRAAKTAVSHHLTRLPAGYRILHHVNPRMGTPHYHLVDRQGNPFYAHYFYSQRAGEVGEETAVLRWQQALNQQGFRATPQFVRGWRQALRAKGLRVPPEEFHPLFANARHLRQTIPGYTTRIAVWRGIAILYQRGNQAESRICLLDVLPAGATAVAVPTRPPLARAGVREAESGGHGWQYQKARQEYLRRLLQDPNQPRFVKGWIVQELRRLEQLNRSRSKGKRRATRLRGVPGYDVGHRLPGVHRAANFRLEHASTNRARPGIARRVGVAHKYR